ncbi:MULTISPECIES: hypothetical protein [unclassified Exiguobacterium]|uniref:hypothetical protein n=1 Tax=unclassified Exiguobacterium TaxID=2644629 RepID=UPI0025C0233A|nr:MULTISPECIES: hypothetical protein [unclassified Exiguobacterium]
MTVYQITAWYVGVSARAIYAMTYGIRTSGGGTGYLLPGFGARLAERLSLSSFESGKTSSSFSGIPASNELCDRIT